MKTILIVLGAAAFLCCSAPREAFVDELPHPLGAVSLPAFPSSVGPGARLLFRVYVDTNGLVKQAELLTPTDEPVWNASAVDAVETWQFIPAQVNGRPVAAWIKMPVIVRFDGVQSIVLSEIVLNSKGDADSVYALLASGSLFDSLARQLSVAPSASHNGYLGKVSLATFPPSTQRTLIALRDGEFTRPLKTDGKFVIYRRTKAE